MCQFLLLLVDGLGREGGWGKEEKEAGIFHNGFFKDGGREKGCGIAGLLGR